MKKTLKKIRRRRDALAKSADAGDHEFQSSLVRAINEASPDGILVVNDKGIIVSHNRRFVEIWQIPGDRLHGLEPGTAVGADDDPILSTVVERVKDPQAFLERALPQESQISPPRRWARGRKKQRLTRQ